MESLREDPTPMSEVDQLPAEIVALDQLISGDSPRSGGPVAEHVRTLAQVEEPLPPILVHRPTMRIIDGMHRVRAAREQGEGWINARFFDGTEEAAFLLAVRANTAHGLPLTRADRTVAAERILVSHPELSDRAIAEVTGLATATIGAIRTRSDAPVEADTRIGRDGRVRPRFSEAGRLRAKELIAARPDASLREIARSAGISPATVRDVRRRLDRGDDPVPPGQRDAVARTGRSAFARASTTVRSDRKPPAQLLRLLCRDPSLRFNEDGRALLTWLNAQVLGVECWPELTNRIPPHSVYTLIELVRGLAQAWSGIADELAVRTNSSPQKVGEHRNDFDRRSGTGT